MAAQHNETTTQLGEDDEFTTVVDSKKSRRAQRLSERLQAEQKQAEADDVVTKARQVEFSETVYIVFEDEWDWVGKPNMSHDRQQQVTLVGYDALLRHWHEAKPRWMHACDAENAVVLAFNTHARDEIPELKNNCYSTRIAE